MNIFLPHRSVLQSVSVMVFRLIRSNFAITLIESRNSMTRYLIVEDERLAYEEICRMMRKLRPTYDFAGWAESVEQAVCLLKAEKFDLLIIDIRLSDGVSFEIFRHSFLLQRREIHLPTPIFRPSLHHQSHARPTGADGGRRTIFPCVKELHR